MTNNQMVSQVTPHVFALFWRKEDVNKSCNLILLFSLAWLGTASVAHAGEEKLLRWKLSQGQMLFLEHKEVTESKGKISDQDISATKTLVTNFSWAVRNVDANENATIDMKLSRIRLTLSGTELPLTEYDSTKGRKPAGLALQTIAIHHGLLDQDIGLVMDRQGRINSVEISPALHKRLEGVSPAAKMAALSARGLQQLCGMLPCVLPENPVSPGSEWSYELGANNFGATASKLICASRYIGAESSLGRTLDLLQSRLTIEMPPSAATAIKSEIVQQSGVASIRFDSTAGRLVSLDSSLQLTSRMTVGERSFDKVDSYETKLSITSN